MPSGQLLLDLLFAQTSLPAVELDGGAGTIRRANAAFAELSGCSSEGLAGRAFLELVPGEDRGIVQARFNAPDSASPLPHHLLAGGGSPVPVLTSVVSSAGSSGSGASLLLIVEASPAPAPAPGLAAPERGNLFRHIVLHAHEGIRTADAQLRTTFVNPRMCEMLGYTADELHGRLLTEFLFPEDVTAHAEEMGRRRQGLSTRYERRFRRKDGTELWTLVSGTPLAGRHGEFSGSFGMFTDITERKRTDRALQLSEERYRNLLEAATDYVFTVHFADGHPVSTTHGPGCVKVSGYPPHEYAADPFLWYRMIAPEDRALVESHIARATAGDRADTIEHRLLHRDGSTRWVRNTLLPRRDSAGRLLALDGLVTDITERTLAAQALRHSEHQLRLIIDTVPALIAYVDPAYRCRLLNRTSALWFGESLETILVRSLPEQLGLGAWQAIRPSVDRALAGENVADEREIQLGTAGRRWLSLCYSPDRNTEGRVLGVVILANDITRHRQLEAQLLRSQRMEVVGRLAGGIAHDLNNILQPVLMAPGLIRPAIHDPETLLLIDSIEASVRRGAEIIKQLLAFARGTETHRRPLQLDDVVTEATRLLGGTFPKDIALRCELPAHPVTILADSTQLQQALMNLCMNARDALRAGGGTVTLRIESVQLEEPLADTIPVSRPGRYQVLTVADTGAGIAPEHLPKLFDPFFTTKDVGEGSGLGLPTVLGIVRSHEGFIHVASSPGQGSAFRVFLPEVPEPVAPPASGSTG